jgi:hypothetical protein
LDDGYHPGRSDFVCPGACGFPSGNDPRVGNAFPGAMSTRKNLVAKYQRRVNRGKVHRDRKKDYKRNPKHKKAPEQSGAF